jgi:hypothetical protein
VDRSQGDVELIRTREGNMLAEAGRDFIIKGVQGEEYPIKKEIFMLTYSTVEANASRGVLHYERLEDSSSISFEDWGSAECPECNYEIPEIIDEEDCIKFLKGELRCEKEVD